MRPLQRPAEGGLANGFHGAQWRLAGSPPDQTAEPHLLRLIDEAVELISGPPVPTRHRKTTHDAAVGDNLPEDAELRFPEQLREIFDLETEAQVRLVRSVPRDGLRVPDPPKRRADLASDLAPDRLKQRLDDGKHGLGA